MKVKIIKGLWEKSFRDYLYIGLGLAFGIALFGFVSYVIALDRVTLQVDGQSFQWQTLSTNVADVLREKGIVLKRGDVVEPALKTPVAENLEIRIIRSFAVQIKADGQTKEFYTVARPVKDVLAAAAVDYDSDDKVSPSLDTVVKPEQKIKIIKVSSTVITKQVTVHPATEYLKDKDMERGQEKIIRRGKPGLAERQVKIVYEDGREVNRYRLAEKITQPAVNTVIARGIRTVVRTLTTSRGSFRYVEVKNMLATAYYPGPESCGKYAAFGQTYTGKKAGFGLVAVDPRVIKLGTMLYIEGYGRAEAADIGGAIKGNRIDLCYETYREAAMYGAKRIKVYILE
jgi:uncharacterized protein YabE (DUF348 family)